MFRTKVQILFKEEVVRGIFVMKLYSEQIALEAKPGQFAHIKCGDDQSFILRRPFSIHRLLGRGAFEILFEVRGKGTAFLSQEPLRAQLDVIGPLGHGFAVKEGLKKAVLVAGGLGIAPLMFLAEDFARRQVKTYVLLGAATKERLLYLIDLKRMTRKVFAATEDGSFGHKGVVTDLLPRALAEAQAEQVFACGPPKMLKRVAEVCEDEKVDCQVSVERRMACGIGACLSCVCGIRLDGETDYKRACVEGPVFNAKDVVWEEFI